MKIRLLHSQWAPFVSALRSRQDVESAGVLLAERLSGSETLLVRDLLLVPDEGYLVRRRDQLRIDPVVFNRLVRTARDCGWSVVTVHTHPGTDRPWFSAADDSGDARLMPSLFAQMAGPHGTLVIAGDTGAVAARLWATPTGQSVPVGMRILGQTLQVDLPTSGPVSDGSDVWCARQRLALGADGQEVLRALHVGIVGLGGTGSVVLTQLAHLGVGRLTLVDGDRVEASNVSRVVGATRRDAGTAMKVDVAARYVEQLDMGTDVRVLRGVLGADVPPDALADCDVILSCVDAHSPRALLNRLAYSLAIPVIDLGSAFRVDEHGRVVAGAGRVVVVGPGRPCLACWGHLDPTRLRMEALSPEERAELAAEGYVQGADVPQPSVIAFNTLISGAAVVELLRLVTAFAGADDPPLRLSFDFITGTVRRNRLAASLGCRICGSGSPEGALATRGAKHDVRADGDLASSGAPPDREMVAH